MINMDAFLVEFLQKNIVTIGIIYAVLKAFATLTPFDGDNKILEALWGAVRSVRPGNGPKPPAYPTIPRSED